MPHGGKIDTIRIIRFGDGGITKIRRSGDKMFGSSSFRGPFFYIKSLAFAGDFWLAGRHNGPLDATGLHNERQFEIGLTAGRHAFPRPAGQGATSLFFLVQAAPAVGGPALNVVNLEHPELALVPECTVR